MENQNQETPVVTEQPTGNENTPATNETPAAPADKVETGPQSDVKPQPDRTFTRDEVTRILKRRIDRYQNNVFTKYGVKDSTELDALFEKAKGYDDIIKSRDELTEKVAFLENNINPERYDDVRTYFKGKGLPFTEEGLKTALESHPEWLKQAPEAAKPSKPITTIRSVGTEPKSRSASDEREIAKKIYGEDLFD